MNRDPGMSSCKNPSSSFSYYVTEVGYESVNEAIFGSNYDFFVCSHWPIKPILTDSQLHWKSAF